MVNFYVMQIRDLKTMTIDDVPKLWKKHGSHGKPFLCLFYLVHGAVVEHPVQVSCNPHTCLWIHTPIPASSPFLKQPSSIV